MLRFSCCTFVLLLSIALLSVNYCIASCELLCLFLRPLLLRPQYPSCKEYSCYVRNQHVGISPTPALGHPGQELYAKRLFQER